MSDVGWLLIVRLKIFITFQFLCSGTVKSSGDNQEKQEYLHLVGLDRWLLAQYDYQ